MQLRVGQTGSRILNRILIKAFTVLERHIYFDQSKKTAWFDELLNTQMKICRGSGVLVKIDGEWKIKHYVLSMTIPNKNVGAVIKIKEPIEDKLISDYNKTSLAKYFSINSGFSAGYDVLGVNFSCVGSSVL
jgi:hypothetical protein